MTPRPALGITLSICLVLGGLALLLVRSSDSNPEVPPRPVGATESRFACPAWCADNAEPGRCRSAACRYCEFECVGADVCPYEEVVEAIHAADRAGGLGSAAGSIGVIWEDATERYLPTDDTSWHAFDHLGYPDNHFAAPFVGDLNGDGHLDIFSAGHGNKGGSPLARVWDLGLSVPHDYPHDGVSTPAKALKGSARRFTRVSHRIESTDLRMPFLDSHGANFADLDNDGVVDLYVTMGGGSKAGHELDDARLQDQDNQLFWGERRADPRTGEEAAVFFVGGRAAARAAGVPVRNARGRFVTFLDANGDGLLDIFTSADRRPDDRVGDGELLINNGDRTWRRDVNVREYSRSFAVTDADGDGVANELLIRRGPCFPQRRDHTTFSAEIKDFCATRPAGTTAVYRWRGSASEGHMELISRPQSGVTGDPAGHSGCCSLGDWVEACRNVARSSVSGDFDGDSRVDHVVLMRDHFVIYYSTDRAPGELPLGAGTISAVVYLPASASQASALRIADFDLDGREELLVMDRGANFYLYEQVRPPDVGSAPAKPQWRIIPPSVDTGALSTAARSSAPPAALLANECRDASDRQLKEQGAGFMQKWCAYHRGERQRPKRRATGVSVADINNDGFQDILVATKVGVLKFFVARPIANRRYVSFKLEGDGHGEAVGATVVLTVRNLFGADDGTRTLFREVSGTRNAGDHRGHVDERVIFGLGDRGVPLKVKVTWPNGHTTHASLDKLNCSDEGCAPHDLSQMDRPILIRQSAP